MISITVCKSIFTQDRIFWYRNYGVIYISNPTSDVILFTFIIYTIFWLQKSILTIIKSEEKLQKKIIKAAKYEWLKGSIHIWCTLSSTGRNGSWIIPKLKSSSKNIKLIQQTMASLFCRLGSLFYWILRGPGYQTEKNMHKPAPVYKLDLGHWQWI